MERSLEEIEGSFWGAPPAGATRLISTAYSLRRTPVGSLTVEDLRLMIGQRIGLAVLVPIALSRLVDEPLAEGDFYPGDLLAAVLGVPTEYWDGRPAERSLLLSVLDAVPAGELAAEIDAFRGA